MATRLNATGVRTGKRLETEILDPVTFEPEITRADVTPAGADESSGYRRASAYDLYLREIGEVDLLTPAEEAALAKRVQRGDSKARDRMIRANLRLVVKIARDYEGFGLPLLDMINEGNIGLMRAVEKFDPTKGAKFSTYSALWIKQSIRRALANQSKTIRIPVHLVDRIARARRASAKLAEELGREATDEELAQEMGIHIRRVQRMRRAMHKTVSLDAPSGEDDSRVLGEMVPDDRAVSAFDEMDSRTRQELVRGMVSRLDSRELSILKQRFGLDGSRARTLDEIGRKVGLTRERIRQLQNEALKKLRRMMEKQEESGLAVAVAA